MQQISVINTITVPAGMEQTAEQVREEYVDYFRQQDGFISSTFYQEINRNKDGTIRYINIVVWASKDHFDRVVNLGFQNADGLNKDGFKVLGRGFPEPIVVSPGQFRVIG